MPRCSAPVAKAPSGQEAVYEAVRPLLSRRGRWGELGALVDRRHPVVDPIEGVRVETLKGEVVGEQPSDLPVEILTDV
jgi:hypothetical protein